MTKLSDLWVILPIGGEGVRMRPYTENRSKALVPLVNHFPQTEFALYGLAADLNLRHFVFGVKGYRNYLDVQSYYQGGAGWSAKLGLSPQVNFQYQNPSYHDQGSADSVLYNLIKFNLNRPVIIVPSDNLFAPADLAAMWQVAARSRLPFFIGLSRSDHPEKYGCAGLDQNSKIARFFEKPKNPPDGCLVNTGIYIIKPAAFSYLKGDFGTDTLSELLRRRLLGGFEFSRPWYDFGSLDIYLDSFLKLLTSDFARIEPFIRRIYRRVPGTEVWIRGLDYHSGPIRNRLTARIKKGRITTSGRVLIGRDCTIEDGVTLENCSVGDLTIIEEGSVIRESNLADAWHIGTGVTIERSVLGRNGLIADYCRLTDSFLGDDINLGNNRTLTGQVIDNHDHGSLSKEPHRRRGAGRGDQSDRKSPLGKTGR